MLISHLQGMHYAVQVLIKRLNFISWNFKRYEDHVWVWEFNPSLKDLVSTDVDKYFGQGQDKARFPKTWEPRNISSYNPVERCRFIAARNEVGARLCFYRRLWFC